MTKSFESQEDIPKLKKIADRKRRRLCNNELLNSKLKFANWHKVSGMQINLKVVCIGNVPKYHIRHCRSAVPLPAGSEILPAQILRTYMARCFPAR